MDIYTFCLYANPYKLANNLSLFSILNSCRYIICEI